MCDIFLLFSVVIHCLMPELPRFIVSVKGTTMMPIATVVLEGIFSMQRKVDQWLVHHAATTPCVCLFDVIFVEPTIKQMEVTDRDVPVESADRDIEF